MTTTSTMKPTLSRLWRPTMRAGRTPCCASNGDAQNDPDPVGNAQRSPNPDDRFLIPEGWISRCFLCPPRLRLMLPATVQPEVLLGVAANHVLQRIGVALGDGASRVRVGGVGLRQDNVLQIDAVTHGLSDACCRH